MPYLVRDACDADMPAVHAIYAHYVRHSVATFEYEVPSLDELLERRRAVLACYLVAVEDERVLGYGYASSFRTRAGYRYTLEDSIYVDPGAQQRGVGTALLTAIVQICERGPWRQMIAVIGDSANTGSIALHARAGFTHVGIQRAVGFKHGRWVDTVEMQRALGAGDGTLP
ncbi:MAG TPA: GNAT family N-acetyltransferase [Polyangiales bacterium]|nr:GNAT family N-acetyltransferase [Polyangiales bacterium]